VTEPKEGRASPLNRLVHLLGACLLRLLSLTLRVHTEGEERLQQLLAAGRPVVLASWHARLLLGIGYMRSYRPFVMISQSRDGDLIAGIGERLGYRPVRGSSSRGGRRALLELERALSPGSLAGHLVDGPRGPAGEIKPGLILLAQRAGAVIIPTYATAAWRWEAHSWDRHQVPLPFSRVYLRFAEPIEVPPELSAEERESTRKRVEIEMARAYARYDAEV
jgi:lysophospholipid acyltransferase (LPLAT)-like uncharacterized protein